MLEEVKINKGVGNEKKMNKFKVGYDKLHKKLKKEKVFKEINSIKDIPNIGAFLIFDKFEVKENLKKTYSSLNKFNFCKKIIWPEKHLF